MSECKTCNGTGIWLWSTWVDAQGVEHRTPYLACPCRRSS